MVRPNVNSRDDINYIQLQNRKRMWKVPVHISIHSNYLILKYTSIATHLSKNTSFRLIEFFSFSDIRTAERKQSNFFVWLVAGRRNFIPMFLIPILTIKNHREKLICVIELNEKKKHILPSKMFECIADKLCAWIASESEYKNILSVNFYF